MSNPGIRITDFFDKLSKSFTGKDGYSFGDFCSQYWYVWLIISIIVVALIFINVGLMLYFRRQRRPFKRLTDEEKEGLTRTITVPQEQLKSIASSKMYKI